MYDIFTKKEIDLIKSYIEKYHNNIMLIKENLLNIMKIIF